MSATGLMVLVLGIAATICVALLLLWRFNPRAYRKVDKGVGYMQSVRGHQQIMRVGYRVLGTIFMLGALRGVATRLVETHRLDRVDVRWLGSFFLLGALLVAFAHRLANPWDDRDD